MQKTNIWTSAVGYRPLNESAAGKVRHTLAIAAAKYDNFCFDTPPLFIFIYHVCLRMIARRVRVHDRPLCMRRVFDFLDWSVGGFCCSQSLSHILKHQLDTTAQQLKGQNKYDVDVSLTEHCRVTDMCRGVSDHLAERSRKSKHRFDKLQRACHYLFASEWKIA